MLDVNRPKWAEQNSSPRSHTFMSDYILHGHCNRAENISSCRLRHENPTKCGSYFRRVCLSVSNKSVTAVQILITLLLRFTTFLP